MIRRLGIGDLDSLLPLGEQFYRASGFAGSFVPEVFKRNWTVFLSADIGVIFGLYEGEKVIGALGVVKVDDLNSGLPVASEMFWFVDAQSRGKGLQLLKAYIAWGRAERRRIYVSYLCSLMPEKIKTVYERFGFQAVEVAYIKEAS